MSDDVCFLITLLYGDQLLKCALKCKRDQLPGDAWEYPMEPDNRAAIHALLPEHVRSCGPIVEVTTKLFDVHIVE